MTLIPQVNATLLSIGGAGFSEDYDTPATAGTPKWTGLAGIYIHEELKSSFNPQGALMRVQQTTLYLNGDLADQAALVLGDSLSYKYRDKTFVARVQNIAASMLPGAPNYVKAALEDINAA